ncbi:MAG: hypothetical protein D6802_08210 [Ardenticatenia bacterium]|nr:MAG: hypothetical protein D6802_08210 [Ardenticatenia bacterium]
MGRRKKEFPCGHKGFGSFCHRCAQEEKERQKRAQKRAAWEATFEHDPIELRHLPRDVVIRAREILALLADGVTWNDPRIKGKLMQFDNTLISIRVTYRYRMLARKTDSGVIPLEVISHEEYNKRYRHFKQ